MSLLKRIMTLILILSIFNLNFPVAVFAKKILLAKADITEHAPMILTTPEINIPVEEKAQKKTNKWVWIGLGVLALGGGAAAAGGGGGGDGGGDGGGGGEPQIPAGPGKGDVTVTW